MAPTESQTRTEQSGSCKFVALFDKLKFYGTQKRKEK